MIDLAFIYCALRHINRAISRGFWTKSSHSLDYCSYKLGSVENILQYFCNSIYFISLIAKWWPAGKIRTLKRATSMRLWKTKKNCIESWSNKIYIPPKVPLNGLLAFSTYFIIIFVRVTWGICSFQTVIRCSTTFLVFFKDKFFSK